jgi:hypothetical protein
MAGFLADDQLTRISFSIFENKGVYALLIGSGVSRSAEIPTGWEITLDLIRRVAELQGVSDQPDWAAWYRKKTGQDPNYSELLGQLATSPDERRSILHSYIEPSDQDREEGKKIPTEAHHAIAELVRLGYVRVILTTNFDRLMENALREAGVEPTIVASVDALSGAEPLMHSACYIVKLHGDYKDARILNTDEELDHYPPEYDALLDRIFDEFGLLVCGWSGEWDHALRSALLRTPNRRYSVFWATRREPNEVAQELISHRRAQLVNISEANSFFRSIQQRLETLERSGQQNPLSVELLINSTKRLLSREEFRIQLADLVTHEANRLLERIDQEVITPEGQWSSAEFQDRVTKYESAVEPVARMVGVLGRWGDGSEVGLVLDLINVLHEHSLKERGGLVIWLRLRSYPTVLVLTAYAIALTRSQRWKDMRTFFNSEIISEGGERERLVEALFLNAWDFGRQNDVWRNLEGLENRKTALSDHLFDIFADWSSSFVDLTSNFELLHLRHELLGSLIHVEASNIEALEKSEVDNTPTGWVWVPIGRLSWQGSKMSRLFEEIQSEPLVSALLAAGFAKGDTRFLELALNNFSRISSRIRWS